MNPVRLIEEYAAGPSRLREAVSGMNAEQLNASPIEGKWSTRQVVCHIADFEPVYVDRMKRVIAQDEPTFFGGDQNLFAARLAYASRDVEEELALIEACRRHMTRILRSLSPDDFQRRGFHSEAGPMSLEKLLSNVTGHIPHHVEFIHEKRHALGCG